jgi:hypothetical protein
MSSNFLAIHIYMTRSKYTIELEKRFGDKLPDKKISTLAKYFKIKKSLIDDAYSRGRGAYFSNPTSVKKGVSSDEQWGKARANKFILNVLKKREGKPYPTGRGHDSDLVEKA